MSVFVFVSGFVAKHTHTHTQLTYKHEIYFNFVKHDDDQNIEAFCSCSFVRSACTLPIELISNHGLWCDFFYQQTKPTTTKRTEHNRIALSAHHVFIVAAVPSVISRQWAKNAGLLPQRNHHNGFTFKCIYIFVLNIKYECPFVSLPPSFHLNRKYFLRSICRIDIPTIFV